MNRAPKRVLRAAAALAAIPAALTTHSTTALATAAVLLALITTAAICWTITDPGRTRRLATLIKATRTNPQPAHPGPAQRTNPVHTSGPKRS
jgi:hypothetical protein